MGLVVRRLIVADVFPWSQVLKTADKILAEITPLRLITFTPTVPFSRTSGLCSGTLASFSISAMAVKSHVLLTLGVAWILGRND